MRRLATFAFALVPAVSHAYCRTTTTGSQPDPTMCETGSTFLGWKRSCTAIRADMTVLPAALHAATFASALAGAADAWNAFSCAGSTFGPAFVISTLAPLHVRTGYFPGEPNVNSVLFRTIWGGDAFHLPDSAAITIVTFTAQAGEILDADTELNLRSPQNPHGFLFATDGSTTAADLPTILTHELGHTQGLAHSAERNAVMWYAAGRGEQRRVPTADDRAGLCAIYPPRPRTFCEADPGRLVFEGGGVSCTAGTGSPRGAGLVAALALVAALRPKRRC